MYVKIIRIIFGLFFVFSGAVKIIDLHSFRDSVVLFDILPVRFINLASITIPSLEFVCGLALVLNVFKKVAISFLILLMTIFAIAVGINLYRGASFECGCLGPFEIFDTISWLSIVFNIGIVAILMFVYLKEEITIKYIEQLKFLVITSLFVALSVNIPFSNDNLQFSLNAQKIKDVNWSRAIDMINSEGAVLFDGRSAQKYEKGHVKNSLSLPLDQFEEYFSKYENIERNTPLLVYCDNEVCGASRRVVYKLILKGFDNLQIVRGGVEELVKIGLVKKTANPESIEKNK